MFGGSPTRRCGVGFGFVLAIAAATPAQEHVRWIADLGDPQASEAAERKLLGLGDKACPPLQELIEAWDTATPRAVERLRAALRVVDLLGDAAAPLGPALTTVAKGNPGPLRVEVMAARASLFPYANEPPWHELFHHGFHATGKDEKPAVFRAFVRMSARSNAHNRDDVVAMRALLEQDGIFAREVAAEALGKAGDAEAVALLSARLLDHDRKPKGWDQVRHNGFAVPIDDQFRLRAGASLVRLAPDDPRSAIGYACLAVEHPHREARLDALRALARFGPDVAPTVPELLQVALQDDAELAAEALKVLGMAGKQAGPHLAAIEALAARAQGAVQKLAAGLAARLRAQGVVPAPAPAAAAVTDERRELDAAVQALADAATEATAAAEAKLLAADRAAAWAALVARFGAEKKETPDQVLRVLGRIGQALPEDERDRIRFAIAGSSGETWSAESMSASTGGSGLRAAYQEAYARLTLGSPETLGALAESLTHENAAVRLVAARELAARRAEIAAPENQKVRDGLLEATRASHPQSSNFNTTKNSSSGFETELDGPIHAAAAAALLDCELPADAWPELLRKVLLHGDAAAVARAIERWAGPAVEAELQKASKDPRPEVSQAATEALARIRAPK